MDDIRYDSIKILILDDNAFARSMSQRILRSSGVGAIAAAASGQEAIDLLGQIDHGIDVVFCDLMMPDMDGVQFTRRMEALASPPALVFLSGADPALLHTAEAAARARGLRVLGVIQKSLTPGAVHRVLAPLGDKRASIRGSATFDVTAQDLDAALEKEQFLLHFQPKISLAGGHVAGFESLVRWLHPDLGLIPPDAFIPIAEQNGRIGALTEKITDLALKQCAAWQAARLHTKMSINLSAYMLVDLELPDIMFRAAERFGIDPRQLILEVTESGVLQDVANTLDILARLHMKGFLLSIDDFGTGYSSMEQLNRIPFAEMKIDRAFVHDVSENPTTMAILKSSAALGRSLKMSVVAEGAETREDLAAVRAAGVDLVQGYFIAKPMAAEDVPGWLAEWDGTLTQRSRRAYEAPAGEG